MTDHPFSRKDLRDLKAILREASHAAEEDNRTPAEIQESYIDSLKEVLSDIGANYLPERGVFLYEGAEYTPTSMAARIHTLIPKPRPIKEAFFAAMEVYLNRQRAEALQKLRTRVLTYEPAVGDEEVEKFIALMTDSSPNPLDVLALKSFIWQVKRKIGGHLVNEYPLMIVFGGGQGFGKSWSLRRLVKPVEQWVAGSTKVSALNDRFTVKMLSDFYIVPFEELAGIKDTDVDFLKAVITEETFTYRPPAGREIIKIPINATFYGTTNRPLRASLTDETGARRWWEIISPNREWTDADTAKLDQIDFERLWRSVDGSTSVNPRRLALAAFRAVQEGSIKSIPVLERFFVEETTELPGNRLSQGELYDAVAAWYTKQGARPPYMYQVREWAEQRGIRVLKTDNRPIYLDVALNKAEE